MEGTVKWYNLKKGYGFIKADSGEDCFVHFSALNGAMLRENDRVSFEVVDTERGKQAQKVKLLQKGSEIKGEKGSDRKKGNDDAGQESEDFGEEESKSGTEEESYSDEEESY